MAVLCRVRSKLRAPRLPTHVHLGPRPRSPPRKTNAVHPRDVIGGQLLLLAVRALHDDRTGRLSRAVVGAIPCQARDPRSKQRHSRSKYADAYTLCHKSKIDDGNVTVVSRRPGGQFRRC
jgi:hypothetical protein